MKLLMTTDCVGGVWTYALDLARALEPDGVEVALATMGPRPSQDQLDAAHRHSNITLYLSDYKLEWMEHPWDDVAAAGRWLLDLEAQLRPNLIHLNGYVHAQLPFLAPIVVAGHSCVLSWWRAVKGEAAPATWERYREEVKSGLMDADVVVAPTQAMLAALDEIYGPLRLSTVIHNARDSSLYCPAAKEPFILAAGRLWDEAKNIAALDHIADALEWPICIAGDGGHSSSSILSLGNLKPSTLAEWMSRAEIYALPARYEPFGLSALEAAHSGCALVLGDVPSLREVWEDNAVFVDPGDSTALHAALQDLIHHPDRRRDYSRRANCHAGRYSLSRMRHAYLSLYRSVIGRRAAFDPVSEFISAEPGA